MAGEEWRELFRNVTSGDSLMQLFPLFSAIISAATLKTCCSKCWWAIFGACIWLLPTHRLSQKGVWVGRVASQMSCKNSTKVQEASGCSFRPGSQTQHGENIGSRGQGGLCQLQINMEFCYFLFWRRVVDWPCWLLQRSVMFWLEEEWKGELYVQVGVVCHHQISLGSWFDM